MVNGAVAPSGSADIMETMFVERIKGGGENVIHEVLGIFRHAQHSAVETMATVITNSKELLLSLKEQASMESIKMIFALKAKIANATGADTPQTLYAGMLIL